MKNDLFNTEIDEIIRASMKLADEYGIYIGMSHHEQQTESDIVPKRSGNAKATSHTRFFSLVFADDSEPNYIYYAGRCSTNSNQQYLLVLLCRWYLFLHWDGWRFAYYSWCKENKSERGFNNPC